MFDDPHAPEPGLFRCSGASVAGPKGQGMWQVRWIRRWLGHMGHVELKCGGISFGGCLFLGPSQFQIVRKCKYSMGHLENHIC